MTQLVLVLSFALASGLLGAAVIADSTSRRTQRLRALRLCLVIAVVVVIAHTIVALDLRFNFTPSMPLGIYRLAPVSGSGVKPGMFVAACVPLVAAELGRHRGYLATGPCPADSELLLKTVAAIAGDEVAISVSGVAVHRRLLPHSRPLPLDAAGRRLLPWPQGHYQLRRGQLWFYAPNNRSWDSRYWGPASPAAVAARAIPLLTFFSQNPAPDALMPTQRQEGGHRQGHYQGLRESASKMKRCQ
jgi:conjugative transfer signal peptidase TraF